MKAFAVFDADKSLYHIAANDRDHSLEMLREELERGFESGDVEALMAGAVIDEELDLASMVEDEDGNELTLAEALKDSDPGVFWCDEW